MKPEIRPLVRRLRLAPRFGWGTEAYGGAVPGVPGLTVLAVLTTMGTHTAGRVARLVVSAGDVDRVVVIGVAGGIGARTGIGDLVVPECVVDGSTGRAYEPAPLPGLQAAGILRTGDDLVLHADELSRLESEGFTALDMETAAIAEACEEAGCPWSVVRAVSDRAGIDDVDEAVAHLAKPDGSPDWAALTRFVLTQPRRVPNLVRLGKGLRVAAPASVDALLRVLPQLVEGAAG